MTFNEEKFDIHGINSKSPTHITESVNYEILPKEYHKFFVTDFSFSYDGLIGNDFLIKYKAVIDIASHKIFIEGKAYKLHTNSEHKNECLPEPVKLEIPARTIQVIELNDSNDITEGVLS